MRRGLVRLFAFILVVNLMLAAGTLPPPSPAAAQSCEYLGTEIEITGSVTISPPGSGDAPILEPAYSARVVTPAGDDAAVVRLVSVLPDADGMLSGNPLAIGSVYVILDCWPGETNEYIIAVAAVPMIGGPNPAAVYCYEQGYEYVVRDEPGGQNGYCVFPNGSECLDWDYYQGTCGPASTEFFDEEVVWRLDGIDCAEEPVEWFLDSHMKYVGAQDGAIRYESWDEYPEGGNPLGWEAERWYDDWDPVARVKTSSWHKADDGTLEAQALGPVPEMLPAGAVPSVGRTLDLLGNDWEVISYTQWMLHASRRDLGSDRRWGWRLTNSSAISGPGWSTPAGEWTLLYDETTGLLVDWYRKVEIYDESGVLETTSFSGLHLTTPDWGGIWGWTTPDPFVCGRSDLIMFEAPTDLDPALAGEAFYRYTEEDVNTPALDLRAVGIQFEAPYYTFVLRTAGDIAWGADYRWYGVLIDTDRNGETGLRVAGVGADYALAVEGWSEWGILSDVPLVPARYLFRWTTDGWVTVDEPVSMLPTCDDCVPGVALDRGTLEIDVHRQSIGGAGGFYFVAFTAKYAAPGRATLIPSTAPQYLDVMPDYGGLFEFSRGEGIAHVPFFPKWSYIGDEVVEISGSKYCDEFVRNIPYRRYSPLERVTLTLHESRGLESQVAFTSMVNYPPPQIPIGQGGVRYFDTATPCSEENCGNCGVSGNEPCTIDHFRGFWQHEANPPYCIDTTLVADGRYDLWAWFLDTAGTSVTSLLPVVVDNTNEPPVVGVVHPADGASVAPGFLSVWVAVSDDEAADNDDEITDISLLVEGYDTDCFEVTMSSWDSAFGTYPDAEEYRLCDVDLTDSTDSSVTLTVSATDSAAQTTTASINVRLDACLASVNPLDPDCADYDGDGVTSNSDCDDTDAANTLLIGADGDEDEVGDCSDICPEAAGSPDYDGCPDPRSVIGRSVEGLCETISGLMPECDTGDDSLGGMAACAVDFTLDCAVDLLGEIPGLSILDTIQGLQEPLCEVYLHFDKAWGFYQQEKDDSATAELKEGCVGLLWVLVDLFGDQIPGYSYFSDYQELMELIDCVRIGLDLGDDIVRSLVRVVAAGANGVFGLLGSPADLMAVDASGRRAGVGPSGEVVGEIPGSQLATVGHFTVIWLPNPADAYRFVVTGNDAGAFDLDVFRSADRGVASATYAEVPVTAGAVAAVTVERTVGSVLELDADGDGTVDEIRSADSVINDGDGDLIPDSSDACPDTPHGCPVDDRGCAPDADGDGVCDARDACPLHDDRLDADADGAVDVPASCVIDVLARGLAPGTLYRENLARPLGDAVYWPDGVVDPMGRFDEVGHLRLEGYATGEQSTGTKISVEVPAQADLLAIPMATALNGPAGETDSEAAIVITVIDPTGAVVSETAAVGVLDTRFGSRYLTAFADVSPLESSEAVVEVRLLHPVVCGGAMCTHDIDLFLGPAHFEALPELCTHGIDGRLMLYDYPGDPTPLKVESCEPLLPVRFLSSEAHARTPFAAHGAGADAYGLAVDLPESFFVLDFRLVYGPRLDRLAVNGTEFPEDAIGRFFPVHPSAYTGLERAARWAFPNQGRTAVGAFLEPGSNLVEAVVAADNDWDERPFSLYLEVMEVIAPGRTVLAASPASPTVPARASETVPPLGSDDGAGGWILPVVLIALAGSVTAAGILARRRRHFGGGAGSGSSP